MKGRIQWALCVGFAACLSASPSWAQDEPPAGEEQIEEAPSEAPVGEESAPEEVAPPAEAAPAAANANEELSADQESAVADAQAGESAAELPGKTYRFIGLRYRGIVVPKFMVNLFADGGKTVYVHAFGPEFAIRKDGFEYNLGLWLGLYRADNMAFKGKSDPELAWELIDSKLNVLYFTSDFLWSQEFSPEFALNYGVGAGFGIVFGDLIRTQSFPPNPGEDDPANYEKCPGPDPLNQPYCDTDNNHYDNYGEPSWANGGSKPIVFPWLALQTGLRYKPSRSVVARLDLGFGTSGFFFGVGADYGL